MIGEIRKIRIALAQMEQELETASENFNKLKEENNILRAKVYELTQELNKKDESQNKA